MNETELLKALQERYRNGEIDFQQYELEKADIQKQSTLFSDFESSLNKTSNTPELTTIFDSPNYNKEIGTKTSPWDNLDYTFDTPQPQEMYGVGKLGIKPLENVGSNNLDRTVLPLETNKAPNFDSSFEIGKLDFKPLENVDNPNIEKEKTVQLMPENQPKEASDVMSMADKYLPFLNPYGTDISTELFSLGRFAGMEKGTQGRGLGIASSALSAGLGGARTFMSGLAQSKQMSRVEEDMRKQLEEKKYTKNAQYLNQNSRGEVTSN